MIGSYLFLFRDRLTKLILSPNLEYKDVTAKVRMPLNYMCVKLRAFLEEHVPSQEIAPMCRNPNRARPLAI